MLAGHGRWRRAVPRHRTSRRWRWNRALPGQGRRRGGTTGGRRVTCRQPGRVAGPPAWLPPGRPQEPARARAPGPGHRAGHCPGGRHVEPGPRYRCLPATQRGRPWCPPRWPMPPASRVGTGSRGAGLDGDIRWRRPPRWPCALTEVNRRARQLCESSGKPGGSEPPGFRLDESMDLAADPRLFLMVSRLQE